MMLLVVCDSPVIPRTCRQLTRVCAVIVLLRRSGDLGDVPEPARRGLGLGQLDTEVHHLRARVSYPLVQAGAGDAAGVDRLVDLHGDVLLCGEICDHLAVVPAPGQVPRPAYGIPG